MQLKFRKRPVVIEAFQMTRERRDSSIDWPEWLRVAWVEESLFIDSNDVERKRLCIGTLKGVHRVEWNDWIIRGVKGNSLCKPDIFDATYEDDE